jgi:hypothetical protein
MLYNENRCGQSDVVTAQASMKNEEQVSEVVNEDECSWKIIEKGINVEGLDEMRGDRIGQDGMPNRNIQCPP